MTVAMLHQIPVRRRNELFHEISRLVEEAGAIDRSLDHIDEGWAIDDSLEEIVQSINDELQLARRARGRAATIVRLNDADSAA